MLQAAPLVWQQHPDVHFAFVGPRTDYSRRLFGRQSDPRIHEVDAVDVQAKSDLLSAATELCVPSSQEAFGGVIVEAWSYGRPVVVGRPRRLDVVAEGDDGSSCRGDRPIVAERLRPAGRPGPRRAMGASGARKVGRGTPGIASPSGRWRSTASCCDPDDPAQPALAQRRTLVLATWR